MGYAIWPRFRMFISYIAAMAVVSDVLWSDFRLAASYRIG